MANSATRPETFEDLQKTIVQAFPTLSKRLQQIAGYALDNPNELALETIATVALRASVQPSSLVRFAQVLGFSGYSEMQRVFRRRLTAAMPDYTERVRLLGGEYPQDAGTLLDEFVTADIVGLRSLLQQKDIGDLLERAFTLIAGAETVYLVAHRRSFPVACYLSYAMSQLTVRNVLVDGVGGMFFQQVGHATPKDVVVAISTKSYSPDVLQAVRDTFQRGVGVVAITDSALSPLVEHATVSLEVQQPTVHMFRSLSVQMTLATTLILGLGRLLEIKRNAVAPPLKKLAGKR
jgi:DNA-binding MurR/RpiR family transcriptional regulator